jgi:two-component system phosphate regulon response regulator PhoB
MSNIVKSPFSPLVLIVDNNESTLANLKLEAALNAQGFITMFESSAQEAMKILNTSIPNMMIVCQDPLYVTANELCLYSGTIEKLSSIVTIVLTKNDLNSITKIDSKSGGPSQYIQCSSDLNTLVGDIKRTYNQFRTASSARILKYMDIELNLNTFQVTRKSKYIDLGPTEFKILQCFLEFQGNILSRDFIMGYVWGKSNPIQTRTVDVHINRLRTALKTHEDELPVVETIRSLGYCLRRMTDGHEAFEA